MSTIDPTGQQGVVITKPKSNVYTTMLFLSFLAILLACLCLWLEMKAYNYDWKATGAQGASARVDSPREFSRTIA